MNLRTSHPVRYPTRKRPDLSTAVASVVLLCPPYCGQRSNRQHPARSNLRYPTAILAAGPVGTSLRKDVSVVTRPVASSARGLNQAQSQSTHVCFPMRPWQKSPRQAWANGPVLPAALVHQRLQSPQGRTSPMSFSALPEPRSCVPNWGALHG